MAGSTPTPRFERLAGDSVPDRDAYYYDVDGSRVPLRAADELAVDLRAAELPPGALERLSECGRELRGDVVMLDGGEVPGEVAEAFDAAGALHPVFGSADGGRVVVMPEVRIEVADEQQAGEVRRYLEASELSCEVVRESGAQLVVRPTSGRGAEALELANRIEEELHPPMSQARFLRIVPRPGANGRR
jgi:hypothetical protein